MATEASGGVEPPATILGTAACARSPIGPMNLITFVPSQGAAWAPAGCCNLAASESSMAFPVHPPFPFATAAPAHSGTPEFHTTQKPSCHAY